MNELLEQDITPAPSVKVMINIGAGLDIPTGTYVEGIRGEHILNAGLAPLTGIVGIGNNFKSTIMHYMFITALARISKQATGATYDTEVNIQEWHMKTFIARTLELLGEDILDTGRWKITDKTVYSGNVWYDKKKNFLNNKIKNAKKLEVDTPFWNRDHTGPFKMLLPTFDEMDSFTDFETDDVIEMQDKNELGDSGGNTIHMRQGLAKLRFLMEAPRLNCTSYNFLLMTAQLGKEGTMQNTGPGGQKPITTLKHLTNGDKIMGTTRKFTYMTHNCWNCFDARPALTDKKTDYPADPNDNNELDTDLNYVRVRNLRSKSGIAGMVQTLVVSQTEGVLPTLTEFHTLREAKRYGMTGAGTFYCMDIYPELSISRTTIRSKIDSDEKLRRAINITLELYQMNTLWRNMPEDLMCSPKQLYDDLKAIGYDWNDLLNSRGWWSLEDEGKLPFLSTMDLLKMRKKEYTPYFYPADKKALLKL